MQVLTYITLFLGVQLASSRHVYFYRRDYNYIQKYDAFYKLHLNVSSTNWNHAFMTCYNEGAQLFYPKEESEHVVVNELMDKLGKTRNGTEVYIGVHDQFHVGEFMTVDGQPLPPFIESKVKPVEGNDNCVVMTSFDYKLKPCSSSSPISYICKRQDKKLCPTIDSDYKYYEQSNKCYKLNNKTEKWEEAMRTCFTEGGVLAIVDDNMQADHFSGVLNLKTNTEYYIGILELYHKGYYFTVKGTKFEGEIVKDNNIVESDLSRFSTNSQFMSQQRYDEVSGVYETMLCAVFAQSQYNSNLNIKFTSCNVRKPFICEIDV